MTKRRLLQRGLIIAATAAVAACVIRNAGPTSIENRPSTTGGGATPAAPAGTMPAVGSYACSFEEDGYQYPYFECAVSVGSDGVTYLEKRGGSQRIYGTVTEANGGFSFAGQFYCPYGDCTENVSGHFAKVGGSEWRGVLGTANHPVVVRLVTALAFGGTTYGGAFYGGGLYGGGLYGGGLYGGGHR
jgi:hypothetical protein